MTAGDEWKVFDYEVGVARQLSRQLDSTAYSRFPWEIQNAIAESTVLHTRIVCQIVLSSGRRRDDIRLIKLLPGFSSPHLAALAGVYGKLDQKGSPCWQFNKLLGQPNTHRDSKHDYSPAITAVWAHLDPLVAQ